MPDRNTELSQSARKVQATLIPRIQATTAENGPVYESLGYQGGDDDLTGRTPLHQQLTPEMLDIILRKLNMQLIPNVTNPARGPERNRL